MNYTGSAQFACTEKNLHICKAQKLEEGCDIVARADDVSRASSCRVPAPGHVFRNPSCPLGELRLRDRGAIFGICSLRNVLVFFPGIFASCVVVARGSCTSQSVERGRAPHAGPCLSHVSATRVSLASSTSRKFRLGEVGRPETLLTLSLCLLRCTCREVSMKHLLIRQYNVASLQLVSLVHPDPCYLPLRSIKT